MLIPLTDSFLVLFLAFCSVSLQVAAQAVPGLSGFNYTYSGQPDFPAASEAFNLRYTYVPRLVAYPVTIEHVSQIVRVAYESKANVVARSGGHSYVAAGLGGKNSSYVIDTQNFKSITYDPSTQTAIIGVGARLGDIITVLNQNGRALPHGTCAYVGWGGHMAFGGYGFTTRLWGLAVDSVIGVDVVLANGTVARATKDVNADLFWALRGAGASFGVITSTTVRTYSAPASATIYSYNWHLTAAVASSALQTYQQFTGSSPSLPSQLGIEVVLTPGERKGYVTFGIAGGWYGPRSQLDQVLQPFLTKMPAPRWNSFDVGDYLNSATNLAGGSLATNEPWTQRDTFYAKSLVIPKAGIQQGAGKAWMDYLGSEGVGLSGLGWFLQIGLLGGANSAASAIPKDDNAFAHRDGLFIIQFYTYSEGNRPPFPSRGFGFLDGMVDAIVTNSPANWDYGAYPNYVDDRLANYEQLYYKQHLARLKTLKRQYDPTGVFDFPTGIKV